MLLFGALVPLAVVSGCKEDSPEDQRAPVAGTDKTVAGSDRGAGARSTEPATPPAPVSPTLPPDARPTDTPHLVIDRQRSAVARRVRLSRGARWMTVVGQDDVISVFDAARGRLLLERPTRPEHLCRHGALSRNGRRVLVRRGRQVLLRNLWTGQAVVTIDRPRGRLRCALSGDDTRILVADTREVAIYDPGRKEPISVVTVPPRFERVDGVLASADASTIVLLGRQGDTPVAGAWGGSGGRTWRSLRGFDGEPVVLGETGGWLAGPLGESATRLWHLWSGEDRKTLPYAMAFHFFDRDRAIAVGNGDGRVVLHDLKKDKSIGAMQTIIGLRGAALSDDGLRLAAAGGDGAEHRMGLWSVEDGRARFAKSQARVSIGSLAWSRAATHFRLDVDRRRLFVSVPSGRLDPSLTKPSPPPLTDSEGLGPLRTGTLWSGIGRPEFVGRELAVVHDASGELLWSARMDDPIDGAAASGAGDRILTLSGQVNIDVFDSAKGTSLGRWTVKTPAVALVTHPARPEVVLAHPTGQISLRVSATGEALWTSPGSDDRAKRPSRLAMSPDGEAVVLAGRRWVRVHRLRGSSTKVLRFGSPIQEVAVAPAGRRVAVSDGFDVTVWDPERSTLVATLTPLPGGGLIVRAGDDALFSPGAKPYLRWRRGLDHIPRNAPEIAPLFEARTARDIPL